MTYADDPAYPLAAFDQDGATTHFQQGLSTREFFAAMALQGLAAAPHVGITNSAQEHAQRAVKFADALIDELNNTKHI
jgi:hypothetical protein